ncbi:MAG: hypothetical protein IKH54_05265 [Bacilli bacterium]|nr:hypothetical protein [Bacilli bacterium]
MAFFNEQIPNDNDKQNEAMNNSNNSENMFVTEEVDVNKKNREDYEKLIEESKTNLDSYYDKNNIFVKLLMLGLLVFIVIGVIYYIMLFMANR